jgi:hypothetical protein
LEDSKISLKNKYELPPTMMQTKSIIRSLEKIHKEQVSVRDMIKTKLDVSKLDMKTIYYKDKKVGYE